MKIEITYILISLFLGILASSIMYLLVRKWKKARYDNEHHKAILEEVRSSFEKQIYALNDRLIQNEERWRDVNHLLLRNQYSEFNSSISKKKGIYYSEFLRENGITENDLLIDDRLIFILTPFHDNFSEDYTVIRDVCTNIGFKCVRGDETYFKGDIFPQMLKFIVKSVLIFANINGRNSNVLYELGIAQALDKPVILISKEPENLPIDIKSKRFLIYNNYEELQGMIRQELKNLLQVNE